MRTSRYYDRYDSDRPGLREAVVYQREGRYYYDDCEHDGPADRRHVRHRQGHHDRDEDRWDD